MQIARSESDAFRQPRGTELGESAWPIPASGATGTGADNMDMGVDSVRSGGGRWGIGGDHGCGSGEGCPFFDGGQASLRRAEREFLTANSFADGGSETFEVSF